MAFRPDTYTRLPDGVRCKCSNLWSEADGSYWCCNTGAVARQSLGDRIIADKAQASFNRTKADELERQARALRHDADEIERLLELARHAHG